MNLIESAVRQFTETFAATPTALGKAPGRVEVLGNHTDYNDGFILSAAIDRHLVLCGRAVEGTTATVHAAQFHATAHFDVTNPVRVEEPFWINYIQGVVAALQEAGIPVGGFEAVLVGDVPLGAGLSSSAALEVATLYFLDQLQPIPLSPIERARLCQQAENRFVGVNCGILDQFSSTMGKAGHLLFLDCRDLSRYDLFPLGTDVELVLANTHAKHALADGTYNRLREACFEAVGFFAEKLDKPVTHLRDVSVEELEEWENGMPEAIRRKARHVITENARVLLGVEALRRGDRVTMGHCMLDSHASSRDDFGNSCTELDLMVRCALNQPGFLGGRLSGGGFGGCTVNLVTGTDARTFAEVLAERYEAETDVKPDMHICRTADGASGQRL